MKRLLLGLLLGLLLVSTAHAQELPDECVSPDTEPLSVVAVDADADLDLDIAVGTTDGMLLLLNDGRGQLEIAREEPPGDDDDSASALPDVLRIGAGAIVDVTVVARQPGQPQQLVGLRSDGVLEGWTLVDGSWSSTWSQTLGSNLRAVAWADVDDDGDMDLAAADEDGVSLHHGDGGVLNLVERVSGLGPTTDVAFALLADGSVALATAGDGVGRIYATSSAGLTELGTTAGTGAQRVIWQDRDGDGTPEALYGSTLESLTITAAGVQSSTPPWDDVNPRGHLLAAAGTGLMISSDGPLAQLKSQEASGDWVEIGFHDRGATGIDLIVAELDAGVPSSVAAGASYGGGDPWVICHAPLHILPPVPLPEQDLPDEPYPRPIGVGDVDGDGWPDLAVLANNTLVVARNDRGTLGEELLRVPDIGPLEALTFADLTGDGRVELLVTGKGSLWPPPGAPADPALQIFLNDDGALQPEPAWSGLVSLAVVADGQDVDRDGRIDLVVAATDGQLTIFAGCDDGPLCLSDAPVWTSQPELLPNAVAWGDLDGDRDLDLAVHTNQNGVHVFTNTSTPGSIALEAAFVLPHTDRGETIAWVDWNDDGLPDLLESTTQTIALHRNVGGSLEPAWLNPDTIPAGPAYAVDWDGDADLDLAVMPNTADLVVVLQDETGPPFGPARLALHDLEVNRAGVIADFDQDGREDFVVGTVGGQSLGVRGALPVDLGLPNQSPRITLHPVLTGAAAAPLSDLPIELEVRLRDPQGDRVQELQLEYSVVGGGGWRRAVQVTGDLRDVAANPDGSTAHLTWDWVREGVPRDHGDPLDHPISHDRVRLRVRAVLAPPSRIAGPIVGRPEVIATSGSFARWPDDDNDGVPNHADPCHLDPANDSDGDGSCDSVDLCLGDDSTGDTDSDGVCDDGDCGEDDPDVRPGRAEDCLDGLDNDCDGDRDMDDAECTAEALAGTGLWCGVTDGASASVLLFLLPLGLRRRRYQHSVGGSPLHT